MTGNMRVWPVMSVIRPDNVCWPAVIFSPVKIDNNENNWFSEGVSATENLLDQTFDFHTITKDLKTATR